MLGARSVVSADPVSGVTTIHGGSVVRGQVPTMCAGAASTGRGEGWGIRTGGRRALSGPRGFDPMGRRRTSGVAVLRRLMIPADIRRLLGRWQRW